MGIIHTCKLARELAASLKEVLTYVSPPEYTRDITEQEIYFDCIENARRMVVKAHNFEQKL